MKTEAASKMSSGAQQLLLLFPRLLLVLWWSPTPAAILCVTSNDITGLKSALATAASNGEDDVVRLQSGHYFMPSNFFLGYIAAEQHDLTIEGGYSDFFGDPCGLVPAIPDATQTVLDGGLLSLRQPDGAGTITLRSLTVSNEVGGIQNGGIAIQIGGTANSTGNIAIYNSIFFGNSSTNNNAIFIVPGGTGTLLIQNSVFASNGAFGSKNPIYFAAAGPSNSLCVGIINSTFTQNASSVAAVDLYVPGCRALVANDIFWGNPSGDIDIHFPASAYLLYDDLGNLGEAANTQTTNLLFLDPMFKPDFSLRDASPLRDAGDGANFVFSPGDFDVVGNPRTYGANPDVGAFEIQDVIFAHGFD